MVKRTAREILERLSRPERESGKAMWYAVMCDTLLDLFESSDTVSIDQLRAAIEKRAKGEVDTLIAEGCKTTIEEIDAIEARRRR